MTVEEKGWGLVERDGEGRVDVISFTVPGKPRTWQRARRGRHGPFFTPEECENKMSEIRDAWRSLALPPFGEKVLIALGVRVFIRRPASHYGTGRNRDVLKPSAPARPLRGEYGGDLDNFVKLVKDALNEVAYVDDSQIAEYLPGTAKYFVGDPIHDPGGELARTEVRIAPIEPVDLARIDGQERLIAA